MTVKKTKATIRRLYGVDVGDDIIAAANVFEEVLRGTELEGEEFALATSAKSSNHWRDRIMEVLWGVDPCSELPVAFANLEPAASREHKFTFIDLFAGIGGFRIALEQQHGKPVFASEWDATAKATYLINHGEYPFGDINKFTNETLTDDDVDRLIPSHDLLAGGFPCQPFSIAGISARNSRGSSHGFECKTQGTLFFSIERIAKVKQPKILFLENVKNLLTHDSGNTFLVIRQSLESLGYRFFWKVINSQTMVPQRRERCFMVAVKEDLATDKGDFAFPDFEGKPLPLSEILEDSAPPELTLSDRMWDGHQARTQRNLDRGTGFTALVADTSRPSNTIVARYGKDGKECLVPQKRGNPRYLTVEECKRLFGYPPELRLPPSRTPSYKLLGNSVVLPVVERVAAAIHDQYLS